MADGHLEALLRFSRGLEAAQSYEEAMAAALETVRAALGYGTVWVYLLTDDKSAARLLTVRGEKSPLVAEDYPTLPIDGDRFLEELRETRDHLVIADARTDPRTDKRIVERLGNRTIINVAITLLDRRLGYLGTGSFGDEGVRLPDPGQLEFLSAMASHMAVTLDRIHLAAERARAEAEVRRLNADLERRVEERTAELREANRELEAFSYSVSHDLRAPLRSIESYSGLLLERCAGELDADGRRWLERVHEGALRMGRLIEALLELSRVSRAPLERSAVDLSALARQLAAELRAAEPARDIGLVVADGLAARADPRLTAALLANLLANAWKFTAKTAGPRVEVGRAGDAFFVRDNGAGFDPAYVGRLFRPFERLHTQGEFPGTGVGLATVARIVRRHGGRVWAEGGIGKGATFYFTLGAG